MPNTLTFSAKAGGAKRHAKTVVYRNARTLPALAFAMTKLSRNRTEGSNNFKLRHYQRRPELQLTSQMRYHQLQPRGIRRMSEERDCHANAPLRRKKQRKLNTVADQFAETLAAAGVKRICGILGAEDRAGFRRSKGDKV